MVMKPKLRLRRDSGRVEVEYQQRLNETHLEHRTPVHA